MEYLVVKQLTCQELTRIFSKIQVQGNGCWLWTGELVDGYGRWRYQGRKELIHRVLYVWATGRKLYRGHGKGTPELDHVICSNRSCCNPTHVKLVPHKVNSLRSVSSPTAINANKTHCIRGHELPSQPNRSDGGRYCKPCASDYGRQKHFQRKSEAVLNG